MVFHCALRGRRLQGSRFVLDVPGSSLAILPKSLVFLGFYACLLIIIRIRGVVLFLKSAPLHEKVCFPTVSERFRDAERGGFIFERSIVDAP